MRRFLFVQAHTQGVHCMVVVEYEKKRRVWSCARDGAIKAPEPPLASFVRLN